MPPRSIDQLSRAIGGLESSVGTLTSETTKVRASVHEINNKLGVMYGLDEKVDQLTRDVAAMKSGAATASDVAVLREQMHEHRNRLAALEKAKWLAQGFAGGAGAVGGAIVSAIVLVISKIWSGSGHP